VVQPTTTSIEGLGTELMTIMTQSQAKTTRKCMVDL
jgi:hypothetical protein